MTQIALLYRQAGPAMPLLDLAHAAQERSFDGIVVGEHTHIPVSRDTPFPGAADGVMPDAYAEFPDPYIALAFIAAQTSLRIAVGVALVAQHDPIALAKAVATLDAMSGGRFTLGVGFGWNREELASHGHKFTERRAVVREHVELMRALWMQEQAEYHGEHASLERSWAWPKPVQQPVPVLLGAQGGERAFEAILGWADGWMPGGGNGAWLAAKLAELRSRWADAGRPGRGPVFWPMENRVLDDDTLRARLELFQSLAADQVVLDIPTAGREEILPLLDRYAKVIGDGDFR